MPGDGRPDRGNGDRLRLLRPGGFHESFQAASCRSHRVIRQVSGRCTTISSNTGFVLAAIGRVKQLLVPSACRACSSSKPETLTLETTVIDAKPGRVLLADRRFRAAAAAGSGTLRCNAGEIVVTGFESFGDERGCVSPSTLSCREQFKPSLIRLPPNDDGTTYRHSSAQRIRLSKF